MASSSQSSGLLPTLFPEPSLTHINNPDKPPSDFPTSNGHTPSGISISNHDFSAAEGELNYLQSDKVMPIPIPMDASKSREILMSSMAESIDGVLDITLHHARDIHNICIYGNQDVYAKFSITHTQDTVYSTQPVRGGGKNPVFNQSLQILISKLDVVLKCEIWMMSCFRTYLEDQLLGFVLVPLANLIGQGRLTQDYALSSTDLFHTPAGTVCLSLMFYFRGAEAPLSVAALERPSSEVMRMENDNHGIMENGQHGMMVNGNHSMPPMDYNSIEFPDLQMASENQQLVSVYLKMASGDLNMDGGSCGQEDSIQQDGMRTGAHKQELSGASFLQLGSSPMAAIDCEMAMNNGEEKSDGCNGSLESPSDHAGFPVDVEVPSPSTISISKTRTTTTEEVSVLETKPSRSVDVPTPVTTHFFRSSNSSQATPSPRSVSSGGALSSSDDKTNGSSDGRDSQPSFTTPLVSISLEPEEPVVQQQIIDMYKKGMQQFTESLAKMKLPLDLNSGQSHVELKNEPQADEKDASSESAMKDSYRVFYGSRAFF